MDVDGRSVGAGEETDRPRLFFSSSSALLARVQLAITRLRVSYYAQSEARQKTSEKLWRDLVGRNK